jgi:hypothetical protein
MEEQIEAQPFESSCGKKFKKWGTPKEMLEDDPTVFCGKEHLLNLSPRHPKQIKRCSKVKCFPIIRGDEKISNSPSLFNQRWGSGLASGGGALLGGAVGGPVGAVAGGALGGGLTSDRPLETATAGGLGGGLGYVVGGPIGAGFGAGLGSGLVSNI